MPSTAAARTADQPSGPSVATYTASGRLRLHTARSAPPAGRPIRSPSYPGSRMTPTSSVPGSAGVPMTSTAGWRGRTSETTWPRARNPDARRASVDATPLISGGYVSVTRHTRLATTLLSRVERAEIALRTGYRSVAPACRFTPAAALRPVDAHQGAEHDGVLHAPRHSVLLLVRRLVHDLRRLSLLAAKAHLTLASRPHSIPAAPNAARAPPR